jgi:hypothetical protein
MPPIPNLPHVDHHTFDRGRPPDRERDALAEVGGMTERDLAGSLVGVPGLPTFAAASVRRTRTKRRRRIRMDK